MDGAWEPALVPALTLRGKHRFLWEFRTIALDSASWLLMGLMVVALMSPVARPMARMLAIPAVGWYGDAVQAALGAAVGLLLPCCSCGVLPIAAGVIESGGSSVAAISMAFVASGSGLDSFFYTAGAAGYPVAAARMGLVALLGWIAAMAACVISKACGGSHVVAAAASCNGRGGTDSNDPAGCEFVAAATDATTRVDSVATEQCSTDAAGCCNTRSTSAVKGPRSGWEVVSEAIAAPITALEEVAPAIVLGIAATAASRAWLGGMAEDYGAVTAATGIDGTPTLRRLLVLAASLPLQLCEHAVVHLAQALLSQGLSAGTVLAFLAIGPSISVGWILLVARRCGAAAGLAALAAAMLGALVASHAVDIYLGAVTPAPREAVAGAAPAELPEWFAAAAPAVLAAMASLSLLRVLRNTMWRRSKVKQN